MPLYETIKCIHEVYTAKEGPVRIQYKCLVSHLCIPRNETVISKTEL